VPGSGVRVEAFGDSAALSDELLALIRSGRKRAGTSLYWSYEAENEPLPRVGDLAIVVDHRNEPVLVTRITEVDVLPHSKVGAEYAACKGEGDGSLEYWQSVHWRIFRASARV